MLRCHVPQCLATFSTNNERSEHEINHWGLRRSVPTPPPPKGWRALLERNQEPKSLNFTEMDDLFGVLGLQENASQREIKQAYHTLARKHHPDRPDATPDQGTTFCRVQAAYEILSNPEYIHPTKRRQPNTPDDQPMQIENERPSIRARKTLHQSSILFRNRNNQTQTSFLEQLSHAAEPVAARLAKVVAQLPKNEENMHFLPLTVTEVGVAQFDEYLAANMSNISGNILEEICTPQEVAIFQVPRPPEFCFALEELSAASEMIVPAAIAHPMSSTEVDVIDEHAAVLWGQVAENWPDHEPSQWEWDGEEDPVEIIDRLLLQYQGISPPVLEALQYFLSLDGEVEDASVDWARHFIDHENLDGVIVVLFVVTRMGARLSVWLRVMTYLTSSTALRLLSAAGRIALDVDDCLEEFSICGMTASAAQQWIHWDNRVLGFALAASLLRCACDNGNLHSWYLGDLQLRSAAVQTLAQSVAGRQKLLDSCLRQCDYETAQLLLDQFPHSQSQFTSTFQQLLYDFSLPFDHRRQVAGFWMHNASRGADLEVACSSAAELLFISSQDKALVLAMRPLVAWWRDGTRRMNQHEARAMAVLGGLLNKSNHPFLTPGAQVAPLHLAITAGGTLPKWCEELYRSLSAQVCQQEANQCESYRRLYTDTKKMATLIEAIAQDVSAGHMEQLMAFHEWLMITLDGQEHLSSPVLCCYFTVRGVVSAFSDCVIGGTQDLLGAALALPDHRVVRAISRLFCHPVLSRAATRQVSHALENLVSGRLVPPLQSSATPASRPVFARINWAAHLNHARESEALARAEDCPLLAALDFLDMTREGSAYDRIWSLMRAAQLAFVAAMGEARPEEEIEWTSPESRSSVLAQWAMFTLLEVPALSVKAMGPGMRVFCYRAILSLLCHPEYEPLLLSNHASKVSELVLVPLIDSLRVLPLVADLPFLWVTDAMQYGVVLRDIDASVLDILQRGVGDQVISPPVVASHLLFSGHLLGFVLLRDSPTRMASLEHNSAACEPPRPEENLEEELIGLAENSLARGNTMVHAGCPAAALSNYQDALYLLRLASSTVGESFPSCSSPHGFLEGLPDAEGAFHTEDPRRAKLRERISQKRIEVQLQETLSLLRCSHWRKTITLCDSLLQESSTANLPAQSLQIIHSRRGKAHLELGELDLALKDLQQGYPGEQTEEFIRWTRTPPFDLGWPGQDPRLHTMQLLITKHNLSWTSISQLITTEPVQRDAQGFLSSVTGYQHEYAEVTGLEFNTVTGNFSFSLAAAEQGNGLVSAADIKEILALGLNRGMFSLDQPHFDPEDDEARQLSHTHPFQQLSCRPARLVRPDGTPSCVLSTMLHTDLILKYLTSHVEVSALPPFHTRSADFLFDRLPSAVREDLLVLQRSPVKHQMTRFWISSEEIPMSANGLVQKTYQLGQPKMILNFHQLKRQGDGSLVDCKEPPMKNSAESQFAEAFTRHFEIIASCFPEFARLRELMKLMSCVQVLLNLHSCYNTRLQQFDVDKETAKMKEKLNGSVEKGRSAKWPRAVHDLEEATAMHVASHPGTFAALVRPFVRARLEREDQGRLDSLLARILDQHCISPSPRLTIAVKQYLSGEAEPLAELLVIARRNELASRVPSLMTAFQRNGLNICGLKQDTGTLEQGSRGLRCRWVPAALMKSQQHIVYGGVDLHPRHSMELKPQPSPTTHKYSPAMPAGVPRAEPERKVKPEPQGFKYRFCTEIVPKFEQVTFPRGRIKRRIAPAGVVPKHSG